MTTEAEVQEDIREMLDCEDSYFHDIESFEEHGLTNNQGLVIKTADGSEFLITIVQIR